MGDGPGYTGATPNQQAILSNSPTLRPYPANQPYPGDVTGSVPQPQPVVQQSALPPMQPYPAVAAQPTYEQPRYQAAAPQPVLQPVPQAPSGWSAANGTYVTMMPGETVDTLARKYSVPTNAIMAANNWSSPSQALPGSRVVIPTYNAQMQQPVAPAIPRAAAAAPKAQVPFAPAQAQAPRPALAPIAPPAQVAAKLPPKVQEPVKVASIAPQAPVAIKAPSAAQPGVVIGPHVVKKGESLDAIARTYGTTKAKLMAANGLKSETIVIGQKLVLPSGVMLKVAQKEIAPAPAAAPAPMVAKAPVAPIAAQPAAVQPAPVVAKAPQAVAPVAAPQPAPVVVAKQEAPAAVHQSAAVAQEPPVAVESPRVDRNPAFRWPVRGRVIKEFGAKAGSDRNDGINLAVPEGTSVKAAEDGEVIYSSNGLKEYGNLVLVKHSDGWVTAYGNASELLVNKGDKVTRGQIIARAGQTGSVDQPQLHFELRKGQKPVDPTQYLSN